MLTVGNTRLLVVDDDARQLRAVERVLRGVQQVDVRFADNGVDAMLQVGLAKPDLIVMDVFMPGLDGIEACRRIKANPETRDIDIVLATAVVAPDLEEVARAAGARCVVSKPFDVKALVASVATQAAPSEFEVEQTGEFDEVAPAKPATIRGANLVVNMLVDAGVEVVFGLPGGAISPIHDALMDTNIRVVTTRHESGAMFAAAAYARATGKLGVVAVTSGPGALNSMTGLASAWCDGLPVLLLVGEVARPAHGKGVLQDGSSHGLQLVEMARHVTKLSAEVPRPSALPHLLRRAIATACSGRKGPVMLTLPIDVTTAQTSMPRVGGSVTFGEHVAPEILEELIELVRGAKRPLILAGSGVRADGAPARLRTVAERFGCPVATTPKAKGVFPENHPLALGVLGLGGHPSARKYLDSDVDVVIAIGTSLGDMSTDGFAPQLQGTRALVHIDIDARQIGKSYSPTHAVVASAAELLGGLADRLDGSVPRPGTYGVDRHVLPTSQRADKIAPHDAISNIQKLMPADTIYTVDSGEHFLFAVQYLEIVQPDSFIVMTGLGSMGQSIGAAIGAQLAHPTRTVTAICGDGCFAMNAFEIATAVQEHLPIRVFVFNDARLGMVERGHETVYGRRPSYPTAPLDVCSVARGLGAQTMKITDVSQFRAANWVMRQVTGPVIFDVHIDQDIAMVKQDRVATMVADAPKIPMVAKPETLPQRQLQREAN